jgi:hypothetical protein
MIEDLSLDGFRQDGRNGTLARLGGNLEGDAGWAHVLN